MADQSVQGEHGVQGDQGFWSHGMAKWGLFMAVLFVAWFGGWFVVSHFADQKIGEAITRIDDRGIAVNCANRQIKGFPFRIGVNCESLDIAHKRDVFRAKLGSVRTTAQIYAPTKLVAEVDGPLTTWPGGIEVNANWSQMRLFLDARLNGGFDLASLNFKELKIGAREISLGAGMGAVHLRETPDGTSFATGHLDFATDLNKVNFTAPDAAVADANLSIDAMLKQGYRELVTNRRPFRSTLAEGVEGEIRRLLLTVPDDGKLALSGPLELHDDGLLSGTIRVGINNPGAVVAWAEDVDPQLTLAVSAVAQAVAGMGQPAAFGNHKMPSIILKIERGEVRLGFILIGQIPPLLIN